MRHVLKSIICPRKLVLELPSGADIASALLQNVSKLLRRKTFELQVSKERWGGDHL